MKATEQYFSVVLFIMLYKVVLNFCSNLNLVTSVGVTGKTLKKYLLIQSPHQEEMSAGYAGPIY